MRRLAHVVMCDVSRTFRLASMWPSALMHNSVVSPVSSFNGESTRHEGLAPADWGDVRHLFHHVSSISSSEQSHIPPWEKENHRLKSALLGDMLVLRRVLKLINFFFNGF